MKKRSKIFIRLFALTLSCTLIFCSCSVPGVNKTAMKLSNPNADETAQAVYKYICETYQNGILSAQQESTWVDTPEYEIDYIYETTGKLPAMRGFDFINDDFDGDIDLENKVMHIQRGVKEVAQRNGTERSSGREIEVGKLKTASSKRTVPLNSTSVEMIEKLRQEYYFGEDKPLVCDENGNYTKPCNFRKRFYRILDAANIETKGLHSLRHTFATNLVNGIRQADGSIKALTPRQVADLLGHTTSEITEMYYVKRNNDLLNGITDDFNM